MATDPAPAVTPDWDTCTAEADCIGVRAAGFEQCLAHLAPEDLDTFIAGLGPGSDIEARGTTISKELLDRITKAVSPENDPHPKFGTAWFHGAQFSSTAGFYGARFAVAVGLELVCAKRVEFDRAVFSGAAVVTVTAPRLSCTGARFEEGVQLRGRYCELGLDGAVFASASRILGVLDPIAGEDDPASEFREALLGRARKRRQAKAGEGEGTTSTPEHEPWIPVVDSLQQVDCTHLGLSDVDLTRCHFVGALNLDQLTLQGHCRFARPPRSWRWTRRQVLAEECTWRTQQGSHAWGTSPQTKPSSASASADGVSPELLTDVYRSLRRVREGSADGPGAADFYYGEMLFRLRAPSTPRAEKAILAAYWALSGFRLRAWRALAALGILVALTTVLLVGWGLPAGSPVQTVDVTLPPAAEGGDATAVVEQPSPALPPWEERWSGSRLEQGARIALGSVVFRDAGQELTTAGSWTVIAARSLGPVLLALAVLAIRARVKR